MHNNLGNGLRMLGERKEGTDYLYQALSVYSTALEVLPRNESPIFWATVQYNISRIRATLGERECNSEHFILAIEASRAALEEYTYEQTPLEFAKANHLLSLAQTELNSISRISSCQQKNL